MYTLADRTEQLTLQMYTFHFFKANGDIKPSYEKSLINKILHKYFHSF